MRITKIKLQNLNSLRTATTLDFDSEPLSLAGLFAITGDTGAGKTTILDALTLALYGKIPRNTTEGEREVMTYGTGKSLAEVEFEVKDTLYRGKWSIWRAHEKPEGKLQDSRRELSRWDTAKQAFEIIGEKKREIDDAIAEITGLDYDRFCRSVLLSQGEFAAFLKAKPAERSELLERITGTAIYSELSMAAFDRHKLEREQLEQLERELGMLDLMDEAAETALQEEVKSLENAIKPQRKKVEKFRAQLTWLEELKKLKTREKNLTEEKSQIDEQIKSFVSEAERLKLHRKALPLQIPIQRLEDSLIQQNEVEAELSAIAVQIPELSKQLAEAKAQLEQQQQTYREAKEKLVSETPKLEKVKAIDLEINNRAKPLANLQEKAAKLDAKKTGDLKYIQGLEQQLEQWKQEARQHEQWLEENNEYKSLALDLPGIKKEYSELRQLYKERKEKADSRSKVEQEWQQTSQQAEKYQKKSEELKAKVSDAEANLRKLAPKNYAQHRSELMDLLYQEIDQLGEQARQLKELKRLSDTYTELLREQDKLEEQVESLQAEERKINRSLMANIDQLDDWKKELDYRQQIYDQQRAIANYEKDRSTLQEGEPCPICLSTEHPFRKKKFKPFVDQAQRDLDNAKQNYEEVLAEHRRLLNEQQENELKIKQLQGDEVKAISGQVAKQFAAMLDYEEQIAAVSPASGDDDEVNTKQLARKVEETQRRLQERQAIRDQLQKHIRQLDELEKRQQTTQQQWQQAKNEAALKRQELDNLADTLSTLDKRYTKNQEQATQLMSKYGLGFDERTAKKAFETLENAQAEWETTNAKLDKLLRDMELNRSEQKQRQQQLADRKEEAADLQAEIDTEAKALAALRSERTELFGEKDPAEIRLQLQQTIEEAEEKLDTYRQKEKEAQQQLAHKKTTQQDKQKTANALQRKAEQHRQQLAEKAVSAGFKDAEAAKSALLPAEEAQVIEDKQQQLQNRQLELKSTLKETQKELQQAQKRALTEADAGTLQHQLQDAQEQLSKWEREMGALTEKQRTQRERKQKAAGLADKIENQRQQYRRWAQLNEIIGQADGKKFRTFAQGLTLQKLAQLANVHLEQLHGRYLIQKRSEEELELDIIDTYQADNRRSMNTLSGGESFLVSLALALGLSDLAGRHTQIRSLFIDEGFGTLDENTLDLAIATLENLQASGKTIGIISHVKALKERITTQISVEKQGNGFSRVQVVSG